MDGPDVRWDGISHEQIIEWTGKEANAAAAEALESQLQDLATSLSLTADMVNTALQRLHSGEWSGDAATTTAQAMQHLRDFDDVMSHHSNMTVLAVAGQSGNANWAKSSVPPVVDLRAAQMPTGSPMDVLDNTQDYQRLQNEAKNAEERARQVMREYHAMSVDRIAALPPLSPAPQVVIDGGDTITVPDSPRPVGSHFEIDPVRPRGGNTSGDVQMVDSEGTTSSPTGDPAHNAQQTRWTGTAPSGMEQPTSRSTQLPLALSPTGVTSDTDGSRTPAAPVGTIGGPAGTTSEPGHGAMREPRQPRGGNLSAPYLASANGGVAVHNQARRHALSRQQQADAVSHTVVRQARRRWVCLAPPDPTRTKITSVSTGYPVRRSSSPITTTASCAIPTTPVPMSRPRRSVTKTTNDPIGSVHRRTRRGVA